MFEWVGALGLDFEVFGGMGEEVSIAMGLLVPWWLVWEFDVGLKTGKQVQVQVERIKGAKIKEMTKKRNSDDSVLKVVK
ncbi:hypothetical protein TL16_g12595 [Triparma laevis f. inornata]|uniref:Uncharacterized protein n=1 Tax=Triparma laevis f. inornata TaxID=1714386 RepID=A0A9W7EVI8_9STRA|nr:hypothetical protein TL16_g12595 [Triparma laevis f. inornata]